MDEKLRKNLIKALESGEYKQGQGLLHDGKKFCCLGVACDISIEMDWILNNNNEFELSYSLPDKLEDEYEIVPHCDGYDFDGVYMPTEKALSTIGMTFREAAILADMNDKGSTFKDIAKALRNKEV